MEEVIVPAADARRGDWMQTYTGKAFYPMAPRAEDIDPLDIGHALAMVCRFGGHVNRFYSVAEHCVLVSRLVSAKHALWGLLHDAAEAYIGDLVRPMKYQLPAYREAEARIMAAVCNRFDLSLEVPQEVKDVDRIILRDERDSLMPGPAPLPWVSTENVEPFGVRIVGWDPFVARARFLGRLGELGVFP